MLKFCRIGTLTLKQLNSPIFNDKNYGMVGNYQKIIIFQRAFFCFEKLMKKLFWSIIGNIRAPDLIQNIELLKIHSLICLISMIQLYASNGSLQYFWELSIFPYYSSMAFHVTYITLKRGLIWFIMASTY